MHRKKATLIGGATVVAMGIIGVAGSAGTVRDPMPQAGSVTAQGATTTAPGKATCGPPDSAPGFGVPAKSGVVPDVQCMDLQLAEDKARAAGYIHPRSEDASGRGRHSIIDRDWTVTGQAPAPGGSYRKSTKVVLKAVKDGEPSPCG